VALACLELLVPLTWPLENGGEMTVNHHRHTPYLQQSQILYKAGILGYDTCNILRTVVRIGLPAIAMRRDERTTRDEGIIKLMLYFFRNIAIISPVPNLSVQGLEKEVSRSATIEAFRQQDVFALLLTICSNMGEDFDNQDVIILEILFNLIRGIEVEKLWMTEEQRKSRETNDLKNVIREEAGLHRDVKKLAASRHGRFGTMIWVKRDDDKVSTVSGQDNLRDGNTTFLNMDKSKKWNKPQQRRKDAQDTIQDFDKTVRLTGAASELLRNFAEEFLDSGFNPLITHLRKAIEREAERLQDINYRQFFYVVAWFLQAERARRERQKKDHQKAKVQADFEPDSFGLVAGVLNQETFITLNRYMQQSFDNREWQDLSASMRCFTQILLTVQEMTQSPLEEDQEIADNIQNRIFYEETTHDRIVSILKGYKDQGFGYLDACTQLSHVFLRMLERYSKENADLQIRSRRRARRKKKEEEEEEKQAAAEGVDENDEDDERSENEDLVEVAQVSKERKFDFTRFAAKFTSQSSVDTFVALTRFYRDLTVEQLKRAHRFFYRVAFKQDLAVLLFRVNIIALFHKMMKGPEGLDIAHALYKDWSELVRQVLKRLFKKLDERPELFVELLFSKINSTLYYLEYGREKQTAASTRVLADLEVKPAPGRTIEDKIGIVIAVLQQDGKSDLVDWIHLTLKRTVEERQGWEGEALARAEDTSQGSPPPESPKPPYIGKQNLVEVYERLTDGPVIRPTTDEIATAMFRNARLRLLMNLVGFERLGFEDALDATWIAPSALTSGDLGETLSIVEKFVQHPWASDDPNEAPDDLLRRVRHAAKDEDGDDVRRDGFIDDSEGDDGLEEFMFPANIRSKSSASRGQEELKKARRKRKNELEREPVDDEVAEARRKAKQAAALERRRKVKSELYIHDSDEEMNEEESRAFFAREEHSRKRQAERIRRTLALDISDSGAKDKKRTSAEHSDRPEKRRKQDDSDDDERLGHEDDGLTDTESVSSQAHADTSDEEMEDTPVSSQSQGGADETRARGRPLKELRPPPAESGLVSKINPASVGEDEEEEEEVPVASSRRARYRAGFIVDSDDE
jgi:replication fork protection complex subunit Tof1/Swi1